MECINPCPLPWMCVWLTAQQVDNQAEVWGPARVKSAHTLRFNASWAKKHWAKQTEGKQRWCHCFLSLDYCSHTRLSSSTKHTVLSNVHRRESSYSHHSDRKVQIFICERQRKRTQRHNGAQPSLYRLFRKVHSTVSSGDDEQGLSIVWSCPHC